MDDPDLADAKLPTGRRGRVPAALARRDWLGIASDLVVVTAGVLIAFQINQWADRQKQVRDEQEFLERLYGENREAITQLDSVVQGHRNAMEEIGAAVRAKDNPTLLAEYSKLPRFGCLGAVLPSVGLSDTAFQEIVASGKLNIVSDPKLRSVLRKLVANQASAAAELDYGRQLVAQNVSALDSYERYEITANPKQRPPCNMDWAALVRDRRGVNAAAHLYRIQQLMFEVRTMELARSQEAEESLACVLRKPDCKGS
jgi:hypothetical protein